MYANTCFLNLSYNGHYQHFTIYLVWGEKEHLTVLIYVSLKQSEVLHFYVASFFIYGFYANRLFKSFFFW